ncbi:MAG: hypothetical protein IIY58_00100 [Aeriscardovia sp.]|nr:hypothetical protein [Aeriscardovia sp.]
MMLKNALISAITNLETQYQLTPYQKEQLEDYFLTLRPGDFVYPGHVKAKIAVDRKTAYEMLESLKKQGFLNNLYDVYCFDCNKSKED